MATKKTTKVEEEVVATEEKKVEAPVEEAPKKEKKAKKADKKVEEKPAKPMPTEAKAIAKNVRLTPRKARLVIDLVRGKDVQTAQAILNNTNTKASRLILNVLNSAIANAVNNFSANESELYISECYINPGQVLKRIKFGSRTKVDRRDKRTSHITVKVSDKKEAK